MAAQRWSKRRQEEAKQKTTTKQSTTHHRLSLCGVVKEAAALWNDFVFSFTISSSEENRLDYLWPPDVSCRSTSLQARPVGMCPPAGVMKCQHHLFLSSSFIFCLLSSCLPFSSAGSSSSSCQSAGLLPHSRAFQTFWLYQDLWSLHLRWRDSQPDRMTMIHVSEFKQIRKRYTKRR